MDAPTYPPATAFEPPIAAPYELSVESVSIAELMSSAQAWAIVVKHAPALKMIAVMPQTKPYITNFTVDSFVAYGVVNQKAVDEINAELHRLPRNQWPAA